MTNPTKAALLSVVINGFALGLMFTLQPWALRAGYIFFQLGFWILESIFGGAAELGIFGVAFIFLVNTVVMCPVLWAGLAIRERAQASRA